MPAQGHRIGHNFEIASDSARDKLRIDAECSAGCGWARLPDR